jgi:hypothetical protein
MCVGVYNSFCVCLCVFLAITYEEDLCVRGDKHLHKRAMRKGRLIDARFSFNALDLIQRRAHILRRLRAVRWSLLDVKGRSKAWKRRIRRTSSWKARSTFILNLAEHSR